MSTATQTYYTLQKLKHGLPSLPESAVIRDRDGDEVSPRDLDFMKGMYAPYTVTYEVDATPAPLDPSKVKAGDTVTVRVEYTGEDPAESFTVTAVVTEQRGGQRWVGPVTIDREGGYTTTLTDHQPAPEPEPELVAGTVYSARHYMAAGSEPMWFRDWKGAPRFITAAGEDFPPDEVTDVRVLVVIDPAEVDVDALAEALRREWSGKGISETFSWAAIARTVVAELGIEVSR